MQILVLQRRRFEVLLQDVGPDRDLAFEGSVAETDFRPAWELWRALFAIPDLGPTTVSKLIGEEASRVIPIFDSVIEATVLGGRGRAWSPLHAALQEGTTRSTTAATTARSRWSDEAISALRVFDVLAWMDGSGNSGKLLDAKSL